MSLSIRRELNKRNYSSVLLSKTYLKQTSQYKHALQSRTYSSNFKHTGPTLLYWYPNGEIILFHIYKDPQLANTQRVVTNRFLLFQCQYFEVLGNTDT